MDEIIGGTYEGFLLGYLVHSNSLSNVHKLEQSFAIHSHTSSVRCMDISAKFLASGGTDDKIVIIDLKTRKEHTVLMHHNGTVNTVAFTHNGSHLLTGSSDGSLSILRVGSWQVEKKWGKAHNGSPVTAIAIHPSNKLALSIGEDKSLRTWNLVKGRPAFTVNLASKNVNLAHDIKWAPAGDRFAIIAQQTIDIWTIQKAGMEKRITCNSKPTCVTWITDEQIGVGLENGNILIITVTDTKANTYKGHGQRVKCILFRDNVLYTASSSGEVKQWTWANNNLTEKCAFSSGCRITCLSLNLQSQFIKKEAYENEESVSNQNSSNDEVENEADSEVEQTSEKNKLKRNAPFVTVTYEEYIHETPTPKQKRFKKKKKGKKSV